MDSRAAFELWGAAYGARWSHCSHSPKVPTLRAAGSIDRVVATSLVSADARREPLHASVVGTLTAGGFNPGTYDIEFLLN